MLIKYEGRHTEGVFVSNGADGETFIGFGEVAEVPDEIAEALISEQPDAFTKSTRKGKE
jgi:hypothetical protein